MEVLLCEKLNATRSSVYRVFVREGINKVPQKDKDKAKKIKEYELNYLHIDVTYLPKLNGTKYYLFERIICNSSPLIN
ncbi:MAG: hypothetical protein PF487_07040 [Bacteroidales bacterium]|jgi:hypothetical protein|nr:hypothetical protein [Bacteroidales bacterium]